MTTAEHLMARAAARGVDLECVSRASKPSYSVEEVVNGCAGMGYNPFIAALYTLAGDDSVKGDVRRWLEWYLTMERVRQRWTRKVQTVSGGKVCFKRPLVELFLIEERKPDLFRRAPIIRCAFLDVEEKIWRRTVSHQYAAVAAEFHRALIDAEEHIRRKLRQ